jgi:hypothetical protein
VTRAAVADGGVSVTMRSNKAKVVVPANLPGKLLVVVSKKRR